MKYKYCLTIRYFTIKYYSWINTHYLNHFSSTMHLYLCVIKFINEVYIFLFNISWKKYFFFRRSPYCNNTLTNYLLFYFRKEKTQTVTKNVMEHILMEYLGNKIK